MSQPCYKGKGQEGGMSACKVPLGGEVCVNLPYLAHRLGSSFMCVWEVKSAHTPLEWKMSGCQVGEVKAKLIEATQWETKSGVSLWEGPKCREGGLPLSPKVGV